MDEKMINKNTFKWKVKKCDNCGKKYLKGKGITKIWMLEDNKYEDFPEDKQEEARLIKELKGKPHCILDFCKKGCFKEYLKNGK